VGHQEGVGEPRRCTCQGGDGIQFRIHDPMAFKLTHRMCTTSDFRLSSYVRKVKEISFRPQLVSWSTKIGATRNRQNKIVSQNFPTKIEHVQPDIASCLWIPM
jgi:hypothetical protein